MARKTKEEAELTRKKLIKSALLLFSEKGVAHTTLTDISRKAEVTKGAFYWHFKNKLEVFDAIIDEYSTPIEQQADQLLLTGEDPINSLFESMTFFFSKVEDSPELIALFDVYFFKCEYTEELAPKLKLEQQQLMETQSNLALKVLALIELERWPNKTDELVDTVACALVDVLIGSLNRWIATRQGSLTRQVETSIKLVLTGAGIKL